MREVVCVETGETYPSAAAAARAHDVTPGMINHVLKGRQATAGGYKWEYTGENGKHAQRQKRYKGVYRDCTGRVYRSLRAVAKRNNCTIRQVQAAIVPGVSACRLVSFDLFAPIPMRAEITPPTMEPNNLTEVEYWALVLPAIETYRKRGKRLTREQHEARRTIRDTWITAHPPTMADFEGTFDRWRPEGVESAFLSLECTTHLTPRDITVRV